LLLVLAGCASDKTPSVAGTPPQGTVTLRTNAARYGPGDKPTLTLRNDTEGRVGYNLCFVFIHLERREADTWKAVVASLGPEGAGCTLPGYSLQRGETATGEVQLPSDLSVGTYRLTHRVEIESADQTIATDAFEVTA
jgi:hypothetical protein